MQHSKPVKIALLKPEQNIWFIRSNSGIYARHFRKGSVIAIGHLEDAFGGKIGDSIPTEKEIRSALLSNDDFTEFKKDKEGKLVKQINRKGLTYLNQTKRFVNDIKQGDLVVTRTDNGGYSIGICTSSNAYIDHSPIAIPLPEGEKVRDKDKIELKHKLRKEVSWGPTVEANELPTSIKKATSGQLTVTSLKAHKEKIFHLIYPFFTDGESLYFSGKINRKEKIAALIVGNLFQNVSLTGSLITQLTNNNEINEDQLLNALLQFTTKESALVTCQAAFMSPGDFWCKVPLSGNKDFSGQIYAGFLAFLLLTGESEASTLSGPGTGDAVVELSIKREETDPDGIFTDKLKKAEASPLLKKISERANRNRKSLKRLADDRNVAQTHQNLEISTSTKRTGALEDFEFGINVIEIRHK